MARSAEFWVNHPISDSKVLITFISENGQLRHRIKFAQGNVILLAGFKRVRRMARNLLAR